MVSPLELKRRMAGANILGIIIGKPCYTKKPCLVILLEVSKDSKVGFYYVILFFGLTVRLWIEGGRESPLDTKEIV